VPIHGLRILGGQLSRISEWPPTGSGGLTPISTRQVRLVIALAKIFRPLTNHVEKCRAGQSQAIFASESKIFLSTVYFWIGALQR